MRAGVALFSGLLILLPAIQAAPTATAAAATQEAQASPGTPGTPATMTGRIAGYVTVEGANTPIAGARILLFPTTRPTGRMMGMPPQTVADQDGRFVFDKLAPGTYHMDVQKMGFAPLVEPFRAPSLQVSAGQTTEIALHLQKGAVIAGKVLDASGNPVTEARVMALHRLIGNPTGPAAGRLVPALGAGGQQTNDLGEFRIASLAPGEYYVAALPRGGLQFGGPAVTPTTGGMANTTTYYPGTTDQVAAQTVKVAAGETVNSIVFSMQSAPAFRVSGRVVDESGAPVAGAMVMLMADPRSNAFMGPIGNARAGDDGRFTMAEVPSGTYRVNASVPMMMNSGIGAVSSGVVGGLTGRADQRPEVVVNGADVTGVRVIVQRPAPQ